MHNSESIQLQLHLLFQNSLGVSNHSELPVSFLSSGDMRLMALLNKIKCQSSKAGNAAGIKV